MQRRIEEGSQAHDPYRICFYCKQPLILVPRGKGGILCFSHLPRSGACPKKKEGPSKKNIKYDGKGEGGLHTDLKDIVVSYVKNYIDVSEINVDKIIRDRLDRKKWRRADILVTLPNGKRLAIEIQRSGSSLTAIEEREIFYRENGIPLLWIFPGIHLSY